MRVLVTGGAGFIGTHLTRRLCLDARVRLVKVIDLHSGDSDVLSHDKVIFSQGDLSAKSELASVLDGVDIVFHLASHVEPASGVIEEPANWQDCRSTSLLLKAASANGVRRVVLASSAAIYGEQKTFPISESAPINPISFNGRIKSALERSAQKHSRDTGLECVVLRLFNVYGQELRRCRTNNLFVQTLFDAARNDKVLSITGQGNQTRDFVHVNDVVEAFCAAAFLPWSVSDSNRVFNVGTGEENSLRDVVRLLEDVAGLKVATRFADAGDREPSRSVADVTAGRRSLGFSAHIQIREGLRRAWNATRAGVSSPEDQPRLCG